MTALSQPSPERAPAGFTCGLDATLRFISGKWKPLIIYFLAQRSTRYGELRRAVKGVSDKMLIQQLKELESDGLVTRHDYGEIPPRVDYTLTPLGHSLAAALVPLCEWGATNMSAVSKVLEQRQTWPATIPVPSRDSVAG